MADLGEKLVNLNDLRAVYEELKEGQVTASISGNTITINGVSITVPTDGSEVAY